MPNLTAPTDDPIISIIDWLTVNGVDYTVIPHEPRASLAGDQLTIDVWTPNGRGGWVKSPSDGNENFRTVATFTITVPPPADVAEWLRPKCPTCGR